MLQRSVRFRKGTVNRLVEGVSERWSRACGKRGGNRPATPDGKAPVLEIGPGVREQFLQPRDPPASITNASDRLPP